MTKNSIRRLILANIAVMVLGLVLAGFAGPGGADLEQAFAAFAAEQGEAYDAGSDTSLIGYAVALLLMIAGWVGLWQHRQWGLIVYGASMLVLLSAPLFDASTVAFVRPVDATWEGLATLISGALMATAASRLWGTGSTPTKSQHSPVRLAVPAPTPAAANNGPTGLTHGGGEINLQPSQASGDARTVIRDCAVFGGLAGAAIGRIFLSWQNSFNDVVNNAPVRPCWLEP